MALKESVKSCAELWKLFQIILHGFERWVVISCADV